MKRSAFYPVLLVLVVAPFCKAETAEEMLSACRAMTELKISGDIVSMPRTFEAGLCWGAFAVIADDTRWVGKSGQPTFRICAPENSTRTQIIAIFVEYAKRNPSKYSESFHDVALDALREAFPCRVQPEKRH